MIVDSITNQGEYFSDHYLDALLGADLTGLRKNWDAVESKGGSTARSGVKALSGAFFAAKTRVTEGAAAEHDSHVRALHNVVLTGLGFAPVRTEVLFTRGEVEHVTVRCAHVAETSTSGGPFLVALDAGFATELDAALDPNAAGVLLDPLLVGDKPLVKDVKGADGRARKQPLPVTDAVSALFATDEPPRFVLVLAGAIVVLADREKWAEGRFLAVDLDLALSRRDTRAKGELETVAALFGADSLLPDDGSPVLDELAAKSAKHAVGVSKDLRDGIRLSVELLANEAVAQLGYGPGNTRRPPKGLAADLTTESLRFLYRLLFLLYAEARPELGILPLDHPEYVEGYGLDRLRDLALVELTTASSRDGGHLHESLQLLFRLVDRGHNDTAVAQVLLGDTPAQMSETEGLRFERLASTLFDPQATPTFDTIRLRNACLQQVLRLLLLSKERKGHQRGFVSYAQLGINQLGAVYEGLMAYTGFFADRDLYEVAKGGDPDKGTWMVPVADADAFDDEVFVTRPDEVTGQPRRVLHRKGTFVYRLSGRDRQRSASYYTPEVLTRCVVHHALEELLDQGDEPTPAAELLELTICEPALGSGAFLNEAINQLADEYLRRRQDELGIQIDPEHFAAERQKVKAHLALHQCYGVDLNATAVELAEVSLWLNAMHRGLQAPWFGLHLRRGNSLIGARRATYGREQLTKAEWVKRPPRERKLADGPIGEGEIHHFLLPAHGWAAVGDAQQARKLRPDEAKALRAWCKAVTKQPGKQAADRLVALAQRVEDLWERARQRLELAERDLRRHIDVWGADGLQGSGVPGDGSGDDVAGAESPGGAKPHQPLSREAIEQALRDPESPLGRLRLVMDAWCALWFWPIVGDGSDEDGGDTDAPPVPPDLNEWLDTLEAILGAGEPPPADNLLDYLSDLEALVEREAKLMIELGGQPIAKVFEEHPWLSTVTDIASREGFFHWELEMAPVFAKGGFDLQVGNPPWVRPRWDDDLTLAEFDPWFGLVDKAPESERKARRQAVLDRPDAERAYLREVGDAAGLTTVLGSAVEHPVLAGVQTNLYTNFMETVWRHAAPTGISGLLHPESHFTDPAGGQLRRGAYRRLRRHWQFLNGLFLFDDVNDKTIFGVHIYGGTPRAPRFLQMSYLQSVELVIASLRHDGSGELPSVQYPQGGWDLRPHRARVITVDDQVLASWATLFDDPGTPPDEARLLRPVTTADLEALRVLSEQPVRLADHEYHWTSGFHEKGAKADGTIRWETAIPDSWDEVILQGPHFTVATPFAKQPNEHCKHNQDYSAWDLEKLPERVIPRTNYQRDTDRETYESRIDHWNGRPATDYWRHIHREMTQPGLERSLHGALIPPGPTTTGANQVKLPEVPQTALTSGLLSSIPFDYLVKISGTGHIKDYLFRRLPAPFDSPFANALLLRTLLLNCVTADYAPLWEELFDPAWFDDAWTDPIPAHAALTTLTDSASAPGREQGSGSDRSIVPAGTPNTLWRPHQKALGEVGPKWTMDTPLRSDFDRRMALVEIDALAALMLGLTAEQLCAMYRTQFAVLRKYEYGMLFGAKGRKIAKDHQTAGVNQQKDDYKRIRAWLEATNNADLAPGQSTTTPEGTPPDDVPDIAPYVPPFYRPDREAEMTHAYNTFRFRLEVD